MYPDHLRCINKKIKYQNHNINIAIAVDGMDTGD